MKTIKVKAGPNGPVFREGARRALDENGRDVNVVGYGSEIEEVPATRYYLRRVEKGDLVLVREEPKPTAKTAMPASSGKKE